MLTLAILFEIAKKETKKSGVNIQLSKDMSEFSLNLDVRGQRGDEALNSVTEYIDRAIMASASEVRILHGTGNGILRQLIRNYLSTIDVIESARDERVQIGGAGITVVKFNYS